jgi:hypothetical protein
MFIDLATPPRAAGVHQRDDRPVRAGRRERGDRPA